MDTHQNILRGAAKIFFAGLLMIAGFLLLSFILSSIDANNVHAESVDTSPSPNYIVTDMSDSPNAVTSGFAGAAEGLTRMTDSAIRATDDAVTTLAEGTTNTSKAITSGATTGTKVVLNGIGNGLGSTIHLTGKGLSAIVGLPANALGFIADAPIVSSILRPSDHEDVPIIDPDSPELLAALVALPPEVHNSAPTSASPTDTGPIWPIHGQITTRFGVPHRPYQTTHTGLDISDGKRSGITPIKSFRPGKVIEATHSRRGYGNHVIIDHGSGVTSVYAHLASISVQLGQEVTATSTLGLEGSTGMSTGTHLHFEIRVNGRAADPMKFIAGSP